MIKFDSGELSRRVDEVLFYIWDPIGVADEPYARGEYRSYVPMILRLVERGDDPEPIAQLLMEIGRDRMSLTPNVEACRRTAELLLRHKRAVSEGIA